MTSCMRGVCENCVVNHHFAHVHNIRLSLAASIITALAVRKQHHDTQTWKPTNLPVARDLGHF